MTPAELQSWRRQQGLSQEALAALLIVDTMTVSRWERGVHTIPPYLPLTLQALTCTACSGQQGVE